MKLITINAAWLIAIALCGCGTATSRQNTRMDDEKLSGQAQSPSRLETISYAWAKHGLTVSFYREKRDSCWTMTIRDSWDLHDRCGEDTVWEPEKSTCSLEECHKVIDQSLASFLAEKPEARIESMVLEMQVIKELWKEILAEVRGTLERLEGGKHLSRVDTPIEVGQGMNVLLTNSPSVTAIISLLNRHKVATREVGQCGEIVFKDSLEGRKWPDIAALPGAGILFPGAIEFTLHGKRP